MGLKKRFSLIAELYTCGTDDVGGVVSEVVESGGHNVDERAAAR